MITLLNERQRIDLPAQLFGYQFGLRIEPTIYNMAGILSTDYHGGYWEMSQLNNGGFFMHPASDAPFKVSAQNGYGGSLSAQALGIVVCLYAFSNLSFGGDDFADVCAEQYHLLREYAMDHPEVRDILAAID